jgi:hypothetical protein
MNTLGTGLLIGALAAIAVSSCIALFQLSSGAPWKELLGMWWKMLVLTIPAFASTTAAALLTWRYRRDSGMTVAGPITLSSGGMPTRPTVSEAVAGLSLSEVVVQNAMDQASWYYESGLNPTRRAFEENGVPQAIWNSGRHILTTAKIVNGSEWSPEPWIVIEAALDSIYPEDDRVWVSPLGERGMVCLHIDEKARNKRHTSPTPPPEPER